MANTAHNDFYDGAFNVLKNNVNKLCMCSRQPTTRTEAVTTYMLAIATLNSSMFTNGPGDVSGRKTTVSATSGTTITNSGICTYYALVDDTRLLYVSACTRY